MSGKRSKPFPAGSTPASDRADPSIEKATTCPGCGGDVRVYNGEVGCAKALTNARIRKRGKWVPECPVPKRTVREILAREVRLIDLVREADALLVGDFSIGTDLWKDRAREEVGERDP